MTPILSTAPSPRPEPPVPVGDPAPLHVVADGPEDAPAVLLGPSLGTTTEMWEPQVAALAEHLRVLRYDHRGHGRSAVPDGPYTVAHLGRDVLAALDRLGVGHASVVGLSLGGMVGLWLAAHAPERVDRLALLCTSAHLPPAQGWRDRAATVRRRGTAAVADTALERWFTPAFRRAHPGLVARYAGMLVGTPDEGYAGCCEAIAAFDLRDELSAVRAPTLVVAGAEDPATPPAHAYAVADGIVAGGGPAEVVVLEQAAHLASVEQAETVTRLLLHHLTG